MKQNLKHAFSLMEMMIVLLIVSIVAAATAPMVTKKMTRSAVSGIGGSAGSSDGLMKGFTDISNAKGKGISYNSDGDTNNSFVIGSKKLIQYTVPNGKDLQSKLVINTTQNEYPLSFTNSDNNITHLIVDTAKNRVGISNQTPALHDNSVALGLNQEITGSKEGVTILGSGAKAKNANTVVIGNGAIASGSAAIAIGGDSVSTEASNTGAIAIGKQARASATDAIAIGTNAIARTTESICIGKYTQSSNDGDVYIGSAASPYTRVGNIASSYDSSRKNSNLSFGNGLCSISYTTDDGTSKKNYIQLGKSTDTVYIPGNLVVGGHTVLGVAGGEFAFKWNSGQKIVSIENKAPDGLDETGLKQSISALANLYRSSTVSIHSDRRLKNVGEKFAGGLEALKKLDLYHFTYKKDETKTPHVGVMAQDLQKVFPDAVTTGDDGYLRIRLEDMFYAMINAIKELDAKITEIVTNVQNNTDEINKLKATVSEQQQTIDSQQKAIEQLTNRLDKLEKKQKKLNKEAE